MFGKELEKQLSQQPRQLRTERAAFCIPYWLVILAAVGVAVVAVARSIL